MKKSELVINHSSEFRDRLNHISELSIDIQSSSFNAIDSKSQTFISVIAILVATILGMLAVIIDRLSSCEKTAVQVSVSILLVSLLINIIVFFLAIKSRPFKSGISAQGLYSMKDSSIDEIDEEILNNLYWSVVDNFSKLNKKTAYLKSAEILLIINFIFAIILTIIFINLA